MSLSQALVVVVALLVLPGPQHSSDAFLPLNSVRRRTRTPILFTSSYRTTTLQNRRETRKRSLHLRTRCYDYRRRTTTSTTRLHVIDKEDPGSADRVLKLAEDLSSTNDDQFSPEVATKIADLEVALTSFLEKQQQQQSSSISIPKVPHPPGTPPPLNYLESKRTASEEQQQEGEEGSVRKAEEALDLLRGRLRREEDSLKQAEDALQQSMNEEDILKRAEEALQKSKAATQQRKAEALRRAEECVESTTRLRLKEQEQQAARATISIDTAAQTAANKPRSTSEIAPPSATNGARIAETSPPTLYSTAPSGIAILSNWIQYVDGSITGCVSRKEGFKDGSTVSTSPVAMGAKGGMIIKTESGSEYYLDGLNTGDDTTPQTSAEAPNNNKVTMAPPNVPSIRSWEVTEDGGVSGLIFDSPNAEDGDYVETSPIDAGALENGSVVKTASGNEYYLSPDRAEKTNNIMNAFKDLAAAQKRGTITISQEKKAKRKAATDSALKTLETSKPRSTFSLRNLFGGKKKRRKPTKRTRKVPILTEWTTNEDGTVTGVINGSGILADGDLVTTSPIADGATEAGVTVTTITGSQYFLA